MRRVLPAAGLALACFLALPQGPRAQEAGEGASGGQKPPEEMAREGVELLMRALRGFLEAVPQYGLPRIDENGDIVIPRLRRDPPPGAPEEQEPQDPTIPEETRS